ncbi:hypothetical protein FA15DRAFT_720165 [Coprinopsis marcescibilis]|uniref:Fungal-type protein kinase domain-containing protein n=1 Tax=Coprinopsis marcescibilis TaxID=230819 RepID=A0A5C3KKT5_COPMA|nr:hypothetical protein FA15DRAFT_720165 [Coprinopsis marcescibilis]
MSQRPQPANTPSYSNNGQTPRKTQTLASSVSAAFTNLKKQRDRRMENMKDHTFSCAPAEWFTAFLDDSSNEKWSAETASDVRTQLGEAIFNEERGWNPLPKEDNVYATLNGIYESIIKKAKTISGDDGLKQTTVFRTTPNEPLKRDVLGKKTRPDGQSGMIILPAVKVGLRRGPRLAAKHGSKEKLPEISKQASECAGIYEFKKDKADRPENEKQMVHGASELFYNDPRRRFTFGVTIEGTATRLWFFNHSFICITHEFDCNTDPDSLVRFFLYMTFASEEQLGFDQTVKRLEEATEAYFLYKVEGNYYRTVGNPLAEDSAWLMNSRAVRVWTVRLADKDGKFLSEQENVLKDVWLYDDATSERENYEKLIAAAQNEDKMNPPDNKDDSRTSTLQTLFLTIDHDWAVQLEGGGDDITCLRPDSAKPVLCSQASKGSKRHSTKPAPNPGATVGAAPMPKVDLKHHRRIHRRVIFREIDGLRGSDANDAMQSLAQDAHVTRSALTRATTSPYQLEFQWFYGLQRKNFNIHDSAPFTITDKQCDAYLTMVSPTERNTPTLDTLNSTNNETGYHSDVYTTISAKLSTIGQPPPSGTACGPFGGLAVWRSPFSPRPGDLARASCRSLSNPNYTTQHSLSMVHTYLMPNGHRQGRKRKKCISLYEIDNFKLALQCIVLYAEGLNTFREIGYLHRDISYGNCLVFIPEGGNPIPKISDLEYCKAYSDVSEHDPITGTPEFMATEVRFGMHLFTPVTVPILKVAPKTYTRPKDIFMIEDKDTPVTNECAIVAEPEDIKPFHVHFYHDLEGLIWLLIWFILTHVPVSFKGIMTKDQISKWRFRIDSLFHADPAPRIRLLRGGLFDFKDDIMSWGWYQDLEPVINILDCIASMGNAYAELEKVPQCDLGDGCHRWSDDKFGRNVYEEVWTSCTTALWAILVDKKEAWKVKSMWDLPIVKDEDQSGESSSVVGGKCPATEGDVFEEDGNRAAKRTNTREGGSNLR